MTLIELLVVLVLMALSAAVVFPAVSNARITPYSFALERIAAESQSLVADETLDPIFTRVRKIAINRGEPVRLRVAADGAYAVVSIETGTALADGRIEGDLRWLPDVTVNAMGTCTITRASAPPAGASKWDALACRWRRERAR